MASAFANINAFTGAVSGLLEVSILEAYENPEFIGSQLAPVEPSNTRPFGSITALLDQFAQTSCQRGA